MIGTTDRPAACTSRRTLAVCVCVIALLFAGCGTEGTTDDAGQVAGSLDPAALGEPYLGPLRFVRPVDCTVTVAESVDQDGATAELAYELRFAGERDLSVMSWEGMTMTSVDGDPVPASVANELLAGFLLPSLVVNDAAEVVEVRGFEELAEAIARLDPESDPAVASDPGFLDLMGQVAISKYWDSWFRIWSLWAKVEEPTEDWIFEGPDGSDQEATLRSLGRTSDGLVALRYETSLTGSSLQASMDEFIDSLAIEADVDSAGARFSEIDGSVDYLIEVVTDPATLWPRSVLSERRVRIEFESRSEIQTERRLSVLDWASSDCA